MSTLNSANMMNLAYTQCAGAKPNSAIENILAKHNLEDFSGLTPEAPLPKHWLETCGTHSATNACIAIIQNPQDWLNKFSTPGGELMRAPDVLCIYQNNPHNAQDIYQHTGVDISSAPIMANEFLAIFPYTVKKVFGIDSEFVEGGNWDFVIEQMRLGHSVQVGLNIPHFICIHGYDSASNSLLYADPAPYRHSDGNWWAAKMGVTEFSNTVRSNFVVYKG